MSDYLVGETMDLSPFIRYGVCSDKGRRHENQDSYLVHLKPEMATLAVADGAGGHQYGKLASQLTVDAIRNELDQNHDYCHQYIELLMKKKYEQINHYIYNEGKKINGLIATTLSVLNMFPDRVVLSNIGDTKIFRIQAGNIKCLSEVHTVANEEYKVGKITLEQLQKHQSKHVLTRAIGAKESINPYMISLDLAKKDLYIICTDGIYHSISEQRMKELFSNKEMYSKEELDELCKQCVREAINNESNDNVSIIAVQRI